MNFCLPQIRGEYRLNYNLAHLTWFKVGGRAEVFFKPYDLTDLVKFLTENTLPVTILGAGSNVIIRDGGIDGVVIKLGQNFNNIELFEDKIKVGASCLNFSLAKFCANASIQGFEFLMGIPGTIGGGIAMNAGAYDTEFKDLIVAIEALDNKGNLIKLSNQDIGFKYRGNSLPSDLIYLNSIFTAHRGETASINQLMQEINATRNLTQPIKEKTGGSTFANPINSIKKAWELIDDAGLRGFSINDAKISNIHCNFMINSGNATAADLENLGELVKDKVYKNSGIELVWEIKRLGKYA